MSGRPSGGSPCGTAPTVTTPSAARSNTLETTMAPTSTTRPHGTRGASRAPPKRMASDTMPTRAVVRVELGDRRQDRPHAILYRTGCRRHTEQAGDLADDDEDDQTEDEAGDDRPGHELGCPAQAGDAADEQADARADGQGGREGHRTGRIPAGHVGDQRSGQHRDRGDGSDDQMRGRAQQGVGDEGQRDGVQADDDGHAGDAGVAERLGNGERCDDESGQDVARDEPPPVAREPSRDRQVVVQR